jgi:hypothetical protein
MQIEQLTQKQNSQVPLYRSKWEEIALTKTFDRSSAEKAIELVYSALSLSTPDIFFAPSPKAAVEVVTSQDFGNPLSEMIAAQFVQEQSDKLPSHIHQSLLYDLNKRFCFLLNAKLSSIENANGGILYPVTKGLAKNKQSQVENCISPSSYRWIPTVALLDFCVSVLQCDYDETCWNALQSILQHCGRVYPFRRGCVICEHPNRIIMEDGTDTQKAKTTISYSDGQEFECVYNDDVGFHWRSKIVQMMYKKYES